AISSLERLFYNAALELAESDPQGVKFLYPSVASGRPAALPDTLQQFDVFDTSDTSAGNLARLTTLAGDHRAQLAITFDMQPIHPTYRALRQGGVQKIISYWGGPISGLSPLWKRLLKRLQIALA